MTFQEFIQRYAAHQQARQGSLGQGRYPGLNSGAAGLRYPGLGGASPYSGGMEHFPMPAPDRPAMNPGMQHISGFSPQVGGQSMQRWGRGPQMSNDPRGTGESGWKPGGMLGTNQRYGQ